MMISCINEEAEQVLVECASTCFKAKMKEDKNYEEKLKCRAMSGSEQQNCFEEVVKFAGEVADCVFIKSGSMDAAKTIDFEVWKKYALDRTSLTAAQKTATKTTFDGCMAAELPSPYKTLHYKPENIPAPLQIVLPILQNAIQFGSLIPAGSIVAADCMVTALIQNGCSSATKEAVEAFMKEKASYKKN